MADDDSTHDAEVSSFDGLLRQLVRGPAAGLPPRALAPGTVVDGRFRVDRQLGRGGTAVVYLAHDVTLRRDVALKVSHLESANGVRRVEREAQALARLVHPNVVTVYQAGSFDDRMYIAMELVAGGTLRAWLAEARTWREIVAVYAAAGDGLAAAHAAGFVHRDVKPDNILVGADGRPRVADFGLVATVAVPPSTAFIALTRTGAIMGTPSYMAPEQLAGEPTDARADQFALCASIWEALFGAPPFPGENVASIAAAIVRGLEPPKDRRGVPMRIVDALRRGLAVAKRDRWPSLPPLLAELRRASRRRRFALVAVGVAAVVTTIAIVAATTARTPEPEPTPPRSSRVVHTWNVPAHSPMVLVRGGRVLAYDPSKVDLGALLPWALAEVRASFPDAEIARIALQNVRRDGSVDLTGPAQLANVPAKIELRFTSKTAPHAACEQRLYATATGLKLAVDEDCDEPAIRPPRCSPAQIWTLLVARHADLAPMQVANMSYYSGDGEPPTWNVEAGGRHDQLEDDC